MCQEFNLAATGKLRAEGAIIDTSFSTAMSKIVPTKINAFDRLKFFIYPWVCAKNYKGFKNLDIKKDRIGRLKI